MRRPWCCSTTTTGSSAPPEPRLRRAALAAVLLASACSGPAPPAANGLDQNALDTAVARAIGDPTTCLLLADGKTGQVVYQYGVNFNCSRTLPACDRPGMLSARQAVPLAAQSRFASCPSVADGSRTVAWAEAKVPNAKRDLVYSAVMEGENTLPGHEMNARLADAFVAAGIATRS